MALKFKLQSRDEIAPPLQSLYVERDGAWVLDVEGAVEKAKLDEFRANNVALLKERDALNSRLAAIQIDQAVVGEASKRGLRATAQEDITARARKLFALVDGVPRAVEADRQTVRVGRDGVTPLSIAEWVEALVADAPHLFEGSAGGGAVGHGSGGASARRNPFRKGAEWNVTEQMCLLKTDPPLAARLKAAA